VLFVVILLFDFDDVRDVVLCVLDEDFGGLDGVDVMVLVIILFD